MDAVDQFKVRALDSMRATVGALESEMEKAKARFVHAEGVRADGEGDEGAAALLAPVRR